jgi:phage baseplate assembly protein W
LPSLNLNERVNWVPNLLGVNPQTIYASDIPTNFDVSPITGDLARVVNKNAIDISLINICNTIMYERPYSDFGAELQLRLFENASSIEMELITSAIRLAINTYEPRVTLTGTNLIISNDENYYSLTISYILVNNPIVQTLSMILQRKR